MAEVEVNDVGSVGVITDQKPYMLPPEAWSTGTNVRVVDTDMEKMPGWSQTFNSPSAPLFAPHFVMAVKTPGDNFWLYTSLTKAAVYDGIVHTDITRLAGDYNAGETRQWNGTLLGGVAILNNGIDAPQMWQPAAAATKLKDLDAWPTGVTAKVIRSFGPFLMAINITKPTLGVLPHMVKWSHPADPGSVPVTWDETDGSHDAGEIELPDVEAGLLVDMLPLGETMYIYKEASVRKCRFVGGRSIFDFGQSAWLTGTGILAPRCVCVTGDGTKQVWASQDDILWHDGNRVRSLLSSRRRRELFNILDPVNYLNSFMFTNPFFGEVWFCYVPTGQTQPTRALVFNYLNGGETWPITTVDGITFRNAALGGIQGDTGEIWQQGTDVWQDNTGPWSVLSRRRIALCGTDAAKFYKLDDGPTRDGVAFTATLQRLGLSVLGKKRNGEWIVDFDRWKLWDTIWPKISGATVQVRIGKQELVDGPVTWMPYVDFDPRVDIKVDSGPISGRALAIEIMSENSFKISGYRTDVVDIGNF
jgi:hypothetical protein